MSDLDKDIRHVFYENQELDTDALAMILFHLLDRIEKLEEQKGETL